MSSCFVLGSVVYVFPCQSTGGDPVLFCRCFAIYDSSFEVCIIFDLDVVAFLSCVEAALGSDAFIGTVCVVLSRQPCRLPSDAFVGGVCVCFSFSSAYGDGASRCVADGQAGCLTCFFVILLVLFAFYGHSSCVSSNFVSFNDSAFDGGVVST